MVTYGYCCYVGLDATSSMELLSHLNKLADSNRTVILTIHQPRLEIFHMFHKLVLLSDGQVCAYVHVYVCVSVCVCVLYRCMYVWVLVHVHIYVYVCVLVYVCVCAYVYV